MRITSENLLEAIGGAFLIIIFVLIGFVLGQSGLDAHEQYECRVWQQQAEDYPLFYQTGWQKEQCDHHGIIINAPIK
jgi:hypothetical protein